MISRKPFLQQIIMGMGKIYSSLTRPLRIFNVANRAEKIISREKPIPAPHHASVAKQKKLADQGSEETSSISTVIMCRDGKYISLSVHSDSHRILMFQ